MNIKTNKLNAIFFRTETGTEPVRDWLRELSKADKKTIGEDIKTVQFGWPLGMPLVDNLGHGLCENKIIWWQNCEDYFFHGYQYHDFGEWVHQKDSSNT